MALQPREGKTKREREGSISQLFLEQERLGFINPAGRPLAFTFVVAVS
jgi:hypothetical protein